MQRIRSAVATVLKWHSGHYNTCTKNRQVLQGWWLGWGYQLESEFLWQLRQCEIDCVMSTGMERVQFKKYCSLAQNTIQLYSFKLFKYPTVQLRRNVVTGSDSVLTLTVSLLHTESGGVLIVNQLWFSINHVISYPSKSNIW